MSPSIIIIYKFLLYLSLISAVLSVQKRDVHRIIIQERVPRSHKKSHPEYSRNVNGQKKGKYSRPHDSQESDSSSYEDSDSFSRENSYEVFRSQKIHKPPIKKTTAHRSPRHPINQKFEESQQHSRRQKPKTNPQNDWVPLNSDQVIQHSQENQRIRDKRNKRKDAKSTISVKSKQKKQGAKTLHVLDLTTAYPLLHFEESTLYPTISWFPGDMSSYNANKHILEENQSPLMSTMKHPKFDFSLLNDNDRLKNHRHIYDVSEAESSAPNTYILVSGNKPDSSSDERHEIVIGKNPKTHTRKKGNRGEVAYLDGTF